MLLLPVLIPVPVEPVELLTVTEPVGAVLVVPVEEEFVLADEAAAFAPAPEIHA